MKIRFDPLWIKTDEQLAAVSALLCLLEEAVPDYEKREQTALRELAERQGLDFGEYDVKRQILDRRFGFWLPRFAAYSVVTLIYAVLEHQLYECARRVGSRTKSRFDNKRGGIRLAVKYLTESGVCDVNVKHDQVWSTLIDLQNLRDLIVHRAGTRGRIDKHRKTVARLIGRYPGRLEVEKTPMDWWNEVKISMDLCRHFTNEVEAFLRRVLSDVDAWEASGALKPHRLLRTGPPDDASGVL